MAKHQEKKRKKDLGIFYTDQRIADFIFDILKIWKEKEEKESGRWESRGHFPSIIDPAVGEGVFLKTAVESKFTKTDWIFGLDIDRDVVKKWKDINLLKEFGGKEDDLEAHFFHQNGLDRIHWEQHIKKYKYKLKKKDIDEQQFNLVAGNPPYGGLGIYEEMKMLSESVLSARKVQKIYTQKLDTLFGEQEERVSKVTTTEHVKLPLSQVKIFELKELSKNLINLEIWKDKKYLPQRINYNLNINGIEINLKDILTLKEIERLKSYPIEILFLERFIQLAKPGGWIAIIIPDGILTNSNSHYVREFIAEKTKVEAIVSLPRETFKQAGTSAKTSILFLRKLNGDEKPKQNYPVFLASVEKNDKNNFQEIIEFYKKYYNLGDKTMNKSNLVQITKDQTGKEALMVRADKTLKEMMKEKPTSRWNAVYWHPTYVKNLKEITDSNFSISRIGDFEERLTYGAIVTGGKNYEGKGVFLLNQGDIQFTGLDDTDIKEVKKDSPWSIERAKVKTKSLVLARSGVGGVGKNRITIITKPINAVVDSFVDVLDLDIRKINPFYVLVFWKTEFGRLQVERIINGVGTVNISFDEIREIKILNIPNSVQHNIESEYKKMSKYHDKAIEAKKNNDEAEYKENIEIAEEMLKDLISKTEAVIRGERKDVI